jgi:glycerol uptake facilitator-like aquaporin
MKTFGFIFDGTCIALGLMVVAGSAGDCDGKCIENANSLGQMLFLVFWGIVGITLGGIICAKTNNL